MVAMFFLNIVTTFFIEDLPNIIPVKFVSNRHSTFRGEDYFCIMANQKEECLYWPCFLLDQNEMRKFCRGP
jgi:hypothetical protein